MRRRQQGEHLLAIGTVAVILVSLMGWLSPDVWRVMVAWIVAVAVLLVGVVLTTHS